MDVTRLSKWLGDKGINPLICDIFEENEIDQDAFTELNDDEIKGMVKPLGVVKKLIRLRNELLQPSNPPLSESQPDDTSPANILTVSSPVSVPRSQPSQSTSLPMPLSSSRLSRSPTPSLSLPRSSETLSQSSGDGCSLPGVPAGFTIPSSWRGEIMECIQAKYLYPKARNALTRDLVVHLYSYGGRPSRTLCQHAARRLTLKYPFMRDACGTGYASWEQKLIDRVYNVEKGHRKRTNDEPCRPSKKKKKGSDRYPPLSHYNLSDEATQSCNYAAMTKELEKPRPRKDVLMEMMKLTFPHRRQQILSDDCESAQEVIDNFPALSYPDIVTQEMELIIGKDLFPLFQREWLEKWVPAIVACAKKRKMDLSTVHEGGDQDDIEQVRCVCSLSKLFTVLSRKDMVKGIQPLSYMFETYNVSSLPDSVAQDVSSPKMGRFVGEHVEYYIFVEGKVFFKCNSFTKAFFIWFSSHYVLNLAYHKYYHDAALFIQEFVFLLPDQKKKSANYLTVATEILNLTR